MIRVIIGDMFKSQAQTLVNTVNCVGIMGKGVALEFKNRFPDMYKEYVHSCERGEVKLGKPYLYKSLALPWILNFPTKDHWRSVSKLSDIEKGLAYLLERYKEWGIESIAVPPLGCGHGQLEWRIVGPTIYRYLSRLDIPVEMYAPHGTPHEELKIEFLEAGSTPGQSSAQTSTEYKVRPAWVALVAILNCIQKEPYHYPIGRTSLQKIAYFATENGIPTGLQFQKSSYGPFSSEMKRLITTLVNNGLIDEGRLGRMLSVQVGRTYSDARQSYLDELRSWRSQIEKIADLFMRMDTRKAEIAATVHFATQSLIREKHETPSEMEVLNYVREWKQKRRPALEDKETAVTIRNLARLEWIQVKPSPELPVGEDLAA